MPADAQSPADSTNGTTTTFMSDVQRVLALILVGSFAIIMLVMAMRLTFMGQPTDITDILKTLISSLINVVMIVLGYFFGSSKSKEQSDTSQQKIVEKLTSTQPPNGSGPVAPVPAPTVVVAWWSLLTDAERTAIDVAATTDPRVKAFADSAATGKATVEDLDYLVIKNLLTQERATAIAAA